jgi:hypothetical protein
MMAGLAIAGSMQFRDPAFLLQGLHHTGYRRTAKAADVGDLDTADGAAAANAVQYPKSARKWFFHRIVPRACSRSDSGINLFSNRIK